MGSNPVRLQFMTMEEDYIDRTILKLRRKYSKDELVAALNKQLVSKDIEIGKLKAEIDYLNDLLIKKNNEQILSKEEIRKAIKDKDRENLVNRNTQLQKRNRDLQNRVNDLLSKLLAAERKLNQC